MKTLVTKSFVAFLITAVLFASVGPGAVFAHETLSSGKALRTVGSPAATITWDLPWGLDADPASVNIWTYPAAAIAVTLASVEGSMPSGLLVWHYGGPTEGWRFYKKGWGAVNTLEKLTPGKGYIGIVPTAGVWEIPQDQEPPQPNTEVREVVSQVISAAQGGAIVVTQEMSYSLAGLELVIPPGALQSDQKITIGEVLSGLLPHSEEYVSLGRQISLQPAGLSFTTPATLRMVFSEEEWQAWKNIVPTEDMLLMKLDESSGSWVTVPSQIHGSVLTADIESFSFWDIVFFWRPDDPASDGKIREQAQRWGTPENWDVDSRLESKIMFIDHSKPPVSTTDLTFADEIRALLLAEAMWDKIEDGNFDAGASLAEIVLKNVAEDKVKDLIAKALGIPTLGVLYGVAGLIIESSLEYLREQLGADMFNKQLKAYLSWRGWFFVQEDNQWVWIYKTDLAHDHQYVLADETIVRSDDGWIMCYQRANGTLGCFGYTGPRVPDKSPEEVYNLGNELCGLLDKIYEVDGNRNGLQADRVWLEHAFKGWNGPPSVTINAPNNGGVGQTVTLRGGVTDIEDDPIIWKWQQTDGPAVELVYGSTLQPHFTPAEPGIYGFTLKAWDLLAENYNSASVAIAVIGEDEEVVFPDPNLEAAIREAIEKPTGPIYRSDLYNLTYLKGNNRNIMDLTGLEYCTNLHSLSLEENQIGDISSLVHLTDLSVLYLGYNQISDITPLRNLTNLIDLTICCNQISDISPLANLSNLSVLYLGDNQISHISSLANLTGLTVLDLSTNQISSITPLASLAKLHSLFLFENQISNISPLVENEGLSEGDEVWLWDNPLSSDSINIYIPQLQARGVTVEY